MVEQASVFLGNDSGTRTFGRILGHSHANRLPLDRPKDLGSFGSEGRKLRIVFGNQQDFVRDRIDQCFPTCGDDVVAHSDRAPGFVSIGRFNMDAGYASVPRLLSKILLKSVNRTS